MRKTRKTLYVKARKNSAGGKFQSEMEPVGVLEVADIAERWAESMALKPGVAKTMIGGLEECILDALSEGFQLNFGLVSFYPRLSGALMSRDSDPESEGLFVRGAVKARRPLLNGLKDKIDAVNSYSLVRPRLFSVYDKDGERFDRISEGHKLIATGRDIQMNLEDAEEGVWIERRTKRGYEPVVKAKILHSDHGRVEFMYDSALSSRKYLISVHTRCGRGKDHKVVVCRREVTA